MTRSVKQPLELKRRVSTLRQRKKPNFNLGFSGEDSAFHWLISHGLLVIDRNLMVLGSEIDILAFREIDFTLLLFEVKTRSNSLFCHPTQAVNWKKTWKMWQAGEWMLDNWLNYCQWFASNVPEFAPINKTNPSLVFPKTAQFAIISVIGNQIDCFSPNW